MRLKPVSNSPTKFFPTKLINPGLRSTLPLLLIFVTLLLNRPYTSSKKGYLKGGIRVLACCYNQMMLRKRILEKQETAKKDAQMEQLESTVKDLIGMLIKVRESLEGQLSGQTETMSPEIESACVDNFIPNPMLAKMTALLLVIWAFFFLRGYWNLEK